MKRAHSHRYNVLLVKDDVGKPKPDTRKLPRQGFTYGKPEIRDIEDATAGEYSLPLPFSNHVCFYASCLKMELLKT